MNFRSVLAHADLSSDHIVFDPMRNEISGIIDFGDRAIGDLAIDFAGLFEYGTGFVDSVVSQYSGTVDPRYFHRIQASYLRRWLLFEILYGIECSLQDHIEHGLKELREQIAQSA